MVTDDVRARVLSYIQHQAGKSREAIIALVSTSQAQLLDVVSGVDEVTAGRAPAEGEWSIRELLRHVISAEDGVSRIVRGLAAGQAPAGERSVGSKVEDDTAAALVERLRASNQRLLDVIAALPAEPEHDGCGQAPVLRRPQLPRVGGVPARPRRRSRPARAEDPGGRGWVAERSES